MSKIKVMSTSLSNKIAAGEVIERISSIVKELVENSIDADSTSIKVTLENGGLKSISVLDDGVGMDKIDAKLSFLRHATSKLYRDDDLYFINTLGFRGEALASIQEVSEVELRTSNGLEGSHIIIKGGEVLVEEDAPLRRGTSITVRNLFFNTPARLKFLKSENAELSNVVYYLERLAISKPHIAFSLFNNNREIFKTTKSGDVKRVMHEIYGMNVSSNLYYIESFNDDFDVRGVISNPIVQRKSYKDMHLIINGRIIKNIELNKAINDAYGTYKPKDTYPVCAIYIDTDPTLVDVNIHPTKQDVKISKMDILKSMLTDVIKDTLYNELLIPNIDNPKNIEEELPNNLFIGENIELPINNVSYQEEIDFKIGDKNEKIKSLELYPVGMVFGTYIVCENKEGMFLIDQHAAKERVNFEIVLNGLEKRESISMLIPKTIEFKLSDYEIIKSKHKYLESIGFKIEEFGINTIRVLEHPSWIRDNESDIVIDKVFETILESGSLNIKDFNHKLAATIACKASIKGNTRITLDEAKYLVEEFVKCDNPYTCPHGRPTIIKFSIYELEKMFKRKM